MARGTQCWYNGKVLPVENAKISLFTHALHYGTGAFEGIRAYKQTGGGGAVFRLGEHMDRLIESAKIMGLKLPYDQAELVQAAIDTCKANSFDECYLRPIIFIGDGPLGVNPGEAPPIDVAILAWEWGNYLGNADTGAKMKISSFVRPHVNSSMTKGKITGQYVNSVLAKREAISGGFDEAILLDPEGYVTEGSGENIFIIKDGVIKTTALNSILNGITRQTIMKYLTTEGYKITESRFTRDELWCADEVFLSGTAAEITPVGEIDLRSIGKGNAAGKPGPITLKIKADYGQIVRGQKKTEYSQNWLTPIK